MKFQLKNWEKIRKEWLFLMWPMAICITINILVTPFVVQVSPKLSLLMPLLSLVVFAPFAVVIVRRQKAETARENRELQAKHDVREQAMFGKPLREFEL